MKVTVSWGGGGTKDVFGNGITWTSGESKILCPHNYSVGTTGTANETWKYYDSAHTNLITLAIYGSSAKFKEIHVKNTVTNGSSQSNFWLDYTFGGSIYGNKKTNIVTPAFNTTTITVSPTTAAPIMGDMFNCLVTTSGLTIKWEPITGGTNGIDTWDNWVATSTAMIAAYAGTTTNYGEISCP